MRVIFALLVLSLLALPLGCNRGPKPGKVKNEPNISTPDSLDTALPPPGGATGKKP